MGRAYMNGCPKDVFANMALSKLYYLHRWYTINDKVFEKMHSYELSDRLLQPTDPYYPTPNRMKPKGHQCMIQYFCRPEIFEKYDMDDYFIRHPSYAHDFSVEYPNEFVKQD